jgi:antitoxin CptB
LALERWVTGTRISSNGLDQRRRRLLFRAWHRGIREMDLVMGRFADVHITGFNDAELDAFEELLEIPDQQAFAWITGAEEIPDDFDTAMFRRLRDFHMSNDETL